MKLINFVKRKGEKVNGGFSIRVNSLNQGKVFGRVTNKKMILRTIQGLESQMLGEMFHLTHKGYQVEHFLLYDDHK